MSATLAGSMVPVFGGVARAWETSHSCTISAIVSRFGDTVDA
jgi:hypothetical protein